MITIPPVYTRFLQQVSEYDTSELPLPLVRHELEQQGNGNYSDGFKKLMPAPYILDYSQRKYIYADDRIAQITGYPTGYFKDGGLEFGLKLWNKNDLKVFSEKVLSENLRVLKNTTVEKHDQLLFSCNYRIKTKSGEYKNLLQRSVFLNSAKNGMPLLALGFLTDITHFAEDFKIHHTIQSISNDGSTGLVSSGLYFPDQPDDILSKRQTEVLKWVYEGLNNEQIARQLNISVNTVNNHKRHLLKITGCKNSLGLIKYALRKGLV